MWSVGVIGAGPGVSALHLPTLARLPELFRVVHIADSGSGRADELARRIGARSSSGVGEVFQDERVQLALICSPPAEHASHVRAALDAGVAGILCEKPLATTVAEAEALVVACRDRGVALLIGTNHLYDTGWVQARRLIGELRAPVDSVRVTLSLPPNRRYHRLVTEFAEGGGSPVRHPPSGLPAHVQAGIVRQLVAGLAVHDLPAIRDLVPGFDGVDFARFVAPLGYAVGYRAGRARVQLGAVMRAEGADARWRLTVSAGESRVDVDFPPAFVHDGAASVSVRGPEGGVAVPPRSQLDGYEAEWLALAELLSGEAPLEYEEQLEDTRYAIVLAEAVAAHIEGASS
ncbi:Gfo/Idh/MocA family protein [Pseudoclavibacter sp. AY1H1]|uniref:Gfo/Idh/MocA family protein n=1 Tax=Pseudoclavibacter sp. AY1H1 TaxID=2080584 RepID=UPI000CE8025F|nr:Gfo/Idh/MocA family oxidoreductase [Pseudoclavibacter sp. AY1H1]PPF36941.1 gfo/Idh/MocA family oxidoreductase [Pseudoclavibacter sp. AY1H1]